MYEINTDTSKVLKWGCSNCKYSPKTYKEYCMAQNNPTLFCVDAYTEKSHLCGFYRKKVTK